MVFDQDSVRPEGSCYIRERDVFPGVAAAGVCSQRGYLAEVDTHTCHSVGSEAQACQCVKYFAVLKPNVLLF